MYRSLLVRAAGVAVAVLALLPLGGGVAAAHGGGGPGPEAHVPRVLALEPPVPGLGVDVIEGGARLRIDNRTGVTVSVLPPEGAPRTVEPSVAPGATARWSDPRVVAAAAGPPPPDNRRAWALPLQVGDQPVTIRGEQVWPPPPPTALWWLAAGLAAVATAFVGALAVRERRWAPGLAAVTLVVAGAHVVHVLGSTAVVDGQRFAAAVLGTAGVAVAAWLLAIVGAGLTVARRTYGPLLCALSGTLLALFTADDLVGFSYAVLPFDWGADLDRATTVLTFGGGLGLFVTGVVALNRLTPTSRDSATDAAAP